MTTDKTNATGISVANQILKLQFPESVKVDAETTFSDYNNHNQNGYSRSETTISGWSPDKGLKDVSSIVGVDDVGTNTETGCKPLSSVPWAQLFFVRIESESNWTGFKYSEEIATYCI